MLFKKKRNINSNISYRMFNLQFTQPNATVILLLGYTAPNSSCQNEYQQRRERSFENGLLWDAYRIWKYSRNRTWNLKTVFKKQSFIETLRAEAQNNRKLIIIYSGHGNSNGDLVITSGRGSPALFTSQEFVNLVQAMRREDIQLVLDSCFSAT